MSLPNRRIECSRIFQEASIIKGDIEYSESILPALRNNLDREIVINTQTFLENGRQTTIVIPARNIDELRVEIQLHENKLPPLKMKLYDLYQQSRTNGCPSFP